MRDVIFQLHLSVLHIWAIVHGWVRWWPLLLIMAGVVSLLKPGLRARNSVAQGNPRFTDGKKGEQ